MQFSLVSRVEPWRQRGLDLFKGAILQMLLASRLVSGRRNYKKSRKKHKKPLTKAQLRKARTMFDRFDSGGTGYLTAEDLVRVLQCMGVEASLYQIQHGLNKIDKDEDGNCDFWEFTEMLAWGAFDLIEATEGKGG